MTDEDTRPREAVEWALMALAMAVLVLALTGCASTRQEATVERERIVGVQGGQPTDLTRIRSQEVDEKRKATVDTDEVARVAAEAVNKAVNGAIQGAIPGLGKVMAEAVPKADLAPVLGGLGDAAKMMATMGRDLEIMKASTATKPANPLDPTGPAGGGALALVGLAAAEWQRRGKRSAEDRADRHARHLDETVAGIEAAKGVLPPEQWVRLRNALQTRQSADTQAHIDTKTP